MDNHSGNADITVSNGDLQARNFSGGLKLKIEFGSANFQDANDAQLNINYSDLTARNINKLNLNSRSSTIDIDETGAIELVSSRDKLTVKSGNSLSGESSFSRIRINELEAMCTMNTKYGELRLNTVTRDFRNINIKSEYTDVFLGFNPSDSYSVDLVYDAKTSLNISAPISNQLKKETLNTKLGTVQASGSIGKSGTSHVSVTAKAGSLSVINK
jgi:archaellin